MFRSWLGPALRTALLAVLASVLWMGCSAGEDDEYAVGATPDAGTAPVAVPELSDAARLGAELFAAGCSECHGSTAGGSSQGPPLVDKIYEPGHHADFSFHRAVNQGSPQHHWNFGDMEPVPGLSPEEVDQVICYVRELQYANGIFTDPAGLAVCQARG